MNKEAFYDACSEILGIEHNYSPPPFKRTRWNNRRLGNGRFPGFGLIRDYGHLVIIISRNGSRTFSSHEEALDFLRSHQKA